MDECSNIYHCSIVLKPIDAKYSALTEKIEYKVPEFKVGDRVRITKYKNIYTENWSIICFWFCAKN